MGRKSRLKRQENRPARKTSVSKSARLPVIVACAGAALALALWFGLSSPRLPPDFPDLPLLQEEEKALRELILEADREARARPGSAQAVGPLAMVYHANLYFDQARAAYAMATRLAPSEARWYYGWARLEEEAGRPDVFLELLRKLLTLQPQHRLAQQKLAEILFKQNQLEQAQRVYRQLYQADPSFLPARLGLARLAMRRGDWAGVVDYLKPAAERNPLLRPPHQMLAAAYQALGWKDRAAQEREVLDRSNLTSSLESEDDFQDELNALCRKSTPLLKLASAAESLRHFEEMLKWSRRAVEAAPGDADALHFLARALVLAQGSHPASLAEALRLRDAALKIRPDYPNPLLLLGPALVSQGHLREGEETLRLVLHRYPDSEEAHTSLGIALAGQRKFEEAGSRFREALRINPELAEAWNNWGLILAEQGGFEEAMARYREALRLNPRHADARNNLGIALGELGRHQEALEQFQAALRINPEHFKACNNIGIVMARQGKVAEAERHFSRALQIAPDFVPARENLENLRRRMETKR